MKKKAYIRAVCPGCGLIITGIKTMVDIETLKHDDATLDCPRCKKLLDITDTGEGLAYRK